MSDGGAPSARAGYDLAVIGAGSAGFSAAISAAEQGARVALIGAGTIGGPCGHFGCLPSQALSRAVWPLHPDRKGWLGGQGVLRGAGPLAGLVLHFG